MGTSPVGHRGDGALSQTPQRGPDLSGSGTRLLGPVLVGGPAIVENYIWSLPSSPRGNALHALVSNTAHNNPGFDVLAAARISEVKTFGASTKVRSVVSGVRRGAGQIVRKTAPLFNELEKEVVAVFPTGTGATRLTLAEEALTGTRYASQVAVRAATGLPGTGILLKALPPLGAWLSVGQFESDMEHGEWGAAVGSGTAFTAGAITTAAMAGSFIKGGLPRLLAIASPLIWKEVSRGWLAQDTAEGRGWRR
jgi:hypothetical protein